MRGATDTLRPFHRKLRRIVNWPFLMLIKGYKLLLSPFMGGSCRFTPTCSTYTYVRGARAGGRGRHSGP